MYGIMALVGIVITLVFAVSKKKAISTLPEWAKLPCSECGSGRVKWLRGQDSNSTGEAKFFCKACGHKEHRGGCASELAMENWEAKQ